MAELQTVNTPVHSAYDGQIIENLDLHVASGDAITVTNDNVIIRNCRIYHEGGDGIHLNGASNVTIENCEIINSSPPAGNGGETSEIDNIWAYASPSLTVDHVTLRDGSSGMYLLASPGATLSNVEGYNFHGPMPRGQFVQFDKSGNSSLTNFYVYNDPAHSHPADNVSVYYSPNVTISNGLIDGNNSNDGVGVMFEGDSGGGKVSHVDAVHMGNGAFSSYSKDVTFDFTRSFDNIATDQGRGLPLSNALIWNVSNTGISIEHSSYTHPGNPNNIVWDVSKAVLVDVHQDPSAISMGDPVTNNFAWDNPSPPPPPPENHLPLITSNGGGATASMSVAENATAVTKVVATDSDTGQTLAYSIVPVASGGGADASKFVIDATTGALAFKTAPNFEAPTDALAAANVYDVTVQVSDNKGGIAKQAIAVTVTDQPETPPPPPPPENHLPLITSNGGGATASMSVAENTTAVTKVVATDSDTGQTLAYSIVPVASGGGADASKFVIDATTGALAFKTAPNFEAPTDALAAANVYDVTVQVSDNKGGIAKQAIAVTVTDQPETPPPPPPPENHLPLITSNGGGATASMSVAENATAVTKVVATDSDTGQTLAYSIVPVASGGGADASKFVIDATTGALAFKTAPNFEAPTDALAAANVYDVTVQVSDNKGGIAKQAIAVTVTDQPETPPPPPPPENHLPLITSNGGGATASMSVAENATAVTKVVATDSDTGQTLAYSIVPVASGGGADASKFVIDATTGALAFKTAPNFEAPTDVLAAANVYDVTVQVSDNKGGIAKQAIAVTVTDQPEVPPPTGTGGGNGTGTGTSTSPPPDDLVLRGGRGSDHLIGGVGNDQLYGGRSSDILVGHAGNDVINGERGRDILMGGPGNDVINGNSDKDYLLLDGTRQDYMFAVGKGGVTITNSAGEVDTVKNVEVFHFSDGTNYLVGRNGLVQTGDQSINKFLADSGVDQSYFSATQGAEKLLGNTALWNAVDAASNNPTHADSALADLKQPLHDAFDHAGATGSVDELAALLPWTHHAWTHHE